MNKIVISEINRLTVLPYMSRGIKIDANFTSPNTNDPTVAFIIKNRRKKKFRVTIPNLSVHTEIVEGTKFDYRKRINRHTIRARGPVLAEMMLLVNIFGVRDDQKIERNRFSSILHFRP